MRTATRADVYIFQNDRLIDKLEDVGTFNTADAEQTDEDKEIFVNQQKKIAAFNAYVKKNAIASVGISKASRPPMKRLHHRHRLNFHRWKVSRKWK